MTPPTTPAASPPTMPAWNLALRFALELAALAALGTAGWTLTEGPLRWVAVVAPPLIAAAAWGVFNVAGDPSRSGNAPIEVPGWARLGLELLILGGGAAALAASGQPTLGVVLALLIAAQYLTSLPRVRWLLER